MDAKTNGWPPPRKPAAMMSKSSPHHAIIRASGKEDFILARKFLAIELDERVNNYGPESRAHLERARVFLRRFWECGDPASRWACWDFLQRAAMAQGRASQ